MKIKEKLFSNALPAPIAQRVTAFILAGAFVSVVSVVLLIICLFKGTGFSLIGFPFAVGVALLLYGCVSKVIIVGKGYYELKGECITHNYSAVDRHSSPNGFGVKVTDAEEYHFQDGKLDPKASSEVDMKIYVPIMKKGEYPMVGQSVTVYLPYDAQGYEGRNGLMKYSQVYGYTIE